MDLTKIIGDYPLFVSTLLTCLDKAGIKYDGFQIDHLCYRTETQEGYEMMKDNLRAVSSGFLENIHNGRQISKFLLKDPLSVRGYKIPLIELPAPKAGRFYESGLDHFEMAVGEGFADFAEKYRNLWTGADDGGVRNQTVSITFDNWKTAKFHKLPLVEILKIEGHEFKAPTKGGEPT